jgi:hypothetical protein
MPDSTTDAGRFEELARQALAEITPVSTVGEYVGEVDEGDNVVSVLFASAMDGYPGWQWTVSVTQVEGEDPTVLEAELMPADGALLAPDWVPWSERLAEYKAAQEANESDLAVEGDESEADDESDDDDSDDEDDDDDEADDDDDEDPFDSDVLHGGDLDGVDIDDLDDDSDDPDSDDEPDDASDD